MSRADNSRVNGDIDRVMRDRVMRAVSRVTRRLALEVFTGVVVASPVDTGRFRGNWLPGVGQRPMGTVGTLEPAAPGSGPSGTQLAAASAVIAQQSPDNPTTIYVVNNLPYAQRLEDGYSAQAPAGMVAVTVAALRAAGRNIVARAVLGGDE